MLPVRSLTSLAVLWIAVVLGCSSSDQREHVPEPVAPPAADPSEVPSTPADKPEGSATPAALDPCGGSTVELIGGASWGRPTPYEVRPGTVMVGDGGCASGAMLVSFEAFSGDSTLRVTLDPTNVPRRLGCGQQVSLADGTAGSPVTAARARMFSVGTMERDGARCRTFVGDATFESASHEAELRFALRAPVETFAGLAERYEVVRASTLAVVELRGEQCRYDVLFTYPDGEYGVSLEATKCNLGIEALEDASADLGPVNSALEAELYHHRSPTHVLRDITRASASLVGSANDQTSPCAVLLGFAAPYWLDALDSDGSGYRRPQPTETIRFSTCDGALAPLRAALRDMTPVTFDDE